LKKNQSRIVGTLEYHSKNFCAIYVRGYPSREDKLGFLTIDRPCGDMRLWESVLAVLRMGHVVLYFPGGPPLVADEAVGAAMPSDEVELMGLPRCVQSAQEIVSIIQSF
jgi:hypothetical protein